MAMQTDKREIINVPELVFTQCASLSKFEGNTIPVLVWELKSGIDGLVDCSSFPSQVKLQSCTEKLSWVDRKSLPDI